jgi:GT2 family glycosyltransferase
MVMPQAPRTMSRPSMARPSTGLVGLAATLDATPRLGVVIVNYRGAADTIECLESLLRAPLPMKIVVVENGSGDDSADVIRAWAAGTRPALAESSAMAPLSTPPVAKPVALACLAAGDAGSSAAERLTLIVSPENRGFAGGNNIGLRHLMGDPELSHFWLLNNDTVVTPDAPAALLARLQAGPRIGMCGTIVRHYWAPDRVQALNGFSFNLLTGAGSALGGGGPATQSFDPLAIADATDFVLGASLSVSRDFLVKVGPMAEDYFLYFEEMDWAIRNRRLGEDAFEIGFAHGATIFHKAGRSIGSTSAHTARSAFSDYWMTRSRLKYVWRHHRLLWPWHWLLGFGIILRRLLRRRWRHAGAVLRAMLGRHF